MQSSMEKKAILQLADGSQYVGYSFGYEGSVSGEMVFCTAMAGYPESLTDPSYCGQILVNTYPLIGNYGVPSDELNEYGVSRYFESEKIHPVALIISDYSEAYSHWNAKRSLGDWLKQWRVPGLYGIDTRALTQKLREQGSMLGRIIFDDNEVPFYNPNCENLVAKVSTDRVLEYGNGRYKVVLVDCGMKNNILRDLLHYDVTIRRVPWDYDYTGEEYDGLFITNGPGDPTQCVATIEHLREALKDDRPIMGICLGNQLLALAAGASTYKLKYGHRGHNQSVRVPGTHTCFVTSQNHGFAIDTKTLPDDWEPSFENLNDGTNEGIQHRTRPFFSTQFHPEAAGGPEDTENLFGKFFNSIENYKKQH